MTSKNLFSTGQHSKTMNKTKDIAKLLVIGEDFMEIMGDYMARQDDPDFDVAVEIDDLYTSLSNLYYYCIND
jgi:uncharacterized protein Yka (UPF0111/DUF47 family)